MSAKKIKSANESQKRSDDVRAKEPDRNLREEVMQVDEDGQLQAQLQHLAKHPKMKQSDLLLAGGGLIRGLPVDIVQLRNQASQVDLLNL